MDIRPVAETVAGQPMFAGLDDRSRALLGGCAKHARFRAGAYLFRQGEVADAFFLLRQGRVGLEVEAAGNDAASVGALGAGEIVGVSWLAPPYRWRCDARALEDVRAISFDAACLRRKSEAQPDLGYEIMRRFIPILIQRLQATRLQMLDVDGDRRPPP